MHSMIDIDNRICALLKSNLCFRFCWLSSTKSALLVFCSQSLKTAKIGICMMHTSKIRYLLVHVLLICLISRWRLHYPEFFLTSMIAADCLKICRNVKTSRNVYWSSHYLLHVVVLSCVDSNRAFVLSRWLILSHVCKQTIMHDSWLNIGYEDDQLLPYKEPEQALQDPLLGNLNLLCCEQVVVGLLT